MTQLRSIDRHRAPAATAARRRERQPARVQRVLRTLALVAVIALPGLLFAVHADVRADAFEDKAALISTLLKNATFTSSAMARTKGQPTFAVLGEDELAIALVAAVSAIDINGKPVFVKFIRRPVDIGGAQVVFIASSGKAQTAAVIAIAKTTVGMLTIQDDAGFLGAGGMVSFAGGKLTIAREKVDGAGIKLGAKALAAVN